VLHYLIPPLRWMASRCQRDVLRQCTMRRWWGLLAFLQQWLTLRYPRPEFGDLASNLAISNLSLGIPSPSCLSWAAYGIRDLCLGCVVFSVFIVQIIVWWLAQMQKERCKFGLNDAFLTKKKSSCSLLKVLILLKHLKYIGNNNLKAWPFFVIMVQMPYLQCFPVLDNNYTTPSYNGAGVHMEVCCMSQKNQRNQRITSQDRKLL
jgi:hypothetical protein